MRDILGQEIHQGDLVLWAGSAKMSGFMGGKPLRVMRIGPRHVTLMGDDFSRSAPPRNVVVVTSLVENLSGRQAD